MVDDESPDKACKCHRQAYKAKVLNHVLQPMLSQISASPNRAAQARAEPPSRIYIGIAVLIQEFSEPAES